jgi:hypothetical protein
MDPVWQYFAIHTQRWLFSIFFHGATWLCGSSLNWIFWLSTCFHFHPIRAVELPIFWSLWVSNSLVYADIEQVLHSEKIGNSYFFKNLPLQTRMFCLHMCLFHSVAPRDSASTFEAGQPVQVTWRQIGFSSSTSLTIQFISKGTVSLLDTVELSTVVATYDWLSCRFFLFWHSHQLFNEQMLVCQHHLLCKYSNIYAIDGRKCVLRFHQLLYASVSLDSNDFNDIYPHVYCFLFRLGWRFSFQYLPIRNGCQLQLRLLISVRCVLVTDGHIRVQTWFVTIF